jgi:hypothetical protein
VWLVSSGCSSGTFRLTVNPGAGWEHRVIRAVLTLGFVRIMRILNGGGEMLCNEGARGRIGGERHVEKRADYPQRRK